MYTRYMTDHVSVLTLGVLARFVTTHDLPGICAAAIQAEPWRRERGGGTEVWRDGLWNKDCGGTSIEKMEGQTWICLYNLLSCREVMDKYDINDFRVGVLVKLQSR